jgi:hypothetical protein
MRETVSALRVIIGAFSERSAALCPATNCFFCGHFVKKVTGAGTAFVQSVEVSQQTTLAAPLWLFSLVLTKAA